MNNILYRIDASILNYSAFDLEVAELLAEARQMIVDLTVERDAARFAPLGDNHHNAALCPYCGEPLRKALEALRKIAAATPSESIDAAIAAYDAGNRPIPASVIGLLAECRRAILDLDQKREIQEAQGDP